MPLCGVNAGFLSSAIVRYVDWNKLHKRFYLVDTFTGPVLSPYSSEEIERGRWDLELAFFRAARIGSGGDDWATVS